jgi:cytidyltransferase-like protein
LGKSIVFTNGVFDILHPGHIFSLSQAAREADFLIVGVNSDNSVKRLKGPKRLDTGGPRPVEDLECRRSASAKGILCSTNPSCKQTALHYSYSANTIRYEIR